MDDVKDLAVFFEMHIPDEAVEAFVHYAVEEIFETRPDDMQLTAGEWLAAIRFHFRRALEDNGCCSRCGRKAHEGSCLKGKQSVH
jgi:hypothetical protein